MPLYQVKHICPLTVGQQDELAVAITKIHSEKFTTPKVFVNVTFEDVKDQVYYVAGKRRNYNHILAHVRSGPSRKQAHWNSLCAEVEAAWNEIVGPGLPTVKRAEAGKADTSLRMVMLFGDIIGGMEAGFPIPQAGQDVEWMQENWTAFEARADQGDEEFKDMIDEITQRGLMKQANGDGKTAMQKLEEALGWGDSA